MPTYEYVCNACGHTFDQLQSITARPLRKCPSCRRAALRRLIGTGGGVIFKGSGFYQTDYRSDNYKKAAAAEQKADTPATEAKPETGSAKATDQTSTTSPKARKSGKRKAG